MAGWIKMPLGMELGLGPIDVVLDGDPAHHPYGPQFSAHFHCCQTGGCIKMPLGMEVGLGPDHILLDEDRAPPKRGTAPPFQFLAHVYCGQTALWAEV